jgi:uncharacterized Zn finger protein (UPF0148 family)
VKTPSVKHNRIQDKMKCKFCAGIDFELFQGFFYCTSCGTENQQQDFVYQRFQDSDSNEEEDYPDTESSDSSSAESSENEEDENVDTSTLSDTNENFNGEENDQNIQSAPHLTPESPHLLYLAGLENSDTEENDREIDQ